METTVAIDQRSISTSHVDSFLSALLCHRSCLRVRLEAKRCPSRRSWSYRSQRSSSHISSRGNSAKRPPTFEAAISALSGRLTESPLRLSWRMAIACGPASRRALFSWRSRVPFAARRSGSGGWSHGRGAHRDSSPPSDRSLRSVVVAIARRDRAGRCGGVWQRDDQRVDRHLFPVWNSRAGVLGSGVVLADLLAWRQHRRAPHHATRLHAAECLSSIAGTHR